jgi:hypothetical protein
LLSRIHNVIHAYCHLSESQQKLLALNCLELMLQRVMDIPASDILFNILNTIHNNIMDIILQNINNTTDNIDKKVLPSKTNVC